METKSHDVVVVGAGPAGLTAAFEAQENGWRPVVLERDPDYVGGIARTVRFGPYRFDIGGHRFFSKNSAITAWWERRLPHDFLRVVRRSRILYRGKFFHYPLQVSNALGNLGVVTSAHCLLSYAWARIFPIAPVRSFEDWVVNHFGRKLFTIFFQSYTEKVWGISTRELSAAWAAQRIQGVSLGSVVRRALWGGRGEGAKRIKSLVEAFRYPRCGPGQMWEAVAGEIAARGGQIEQGWQVRTLRHGEGRLVAIEASDAKGEVRTWTAEHFIVSMPLRETVLAFEPPLAPAVQAAARRLRYRDFILVALIVDGENPFPDNWIYVHDPGVMVGRIQNFRNWSDDMVGGTGMTCLGLEYFCFATDELWRRPDAELVELGKRELARMGLVPVERVKDGVVVRMEKAYPVYDENHERDLVLIRAALAEFPNLQVVGRNGMHKYNNQDHSMMTAMLAVKNLAGGRFDLWRVNTDAEYHEEVRRPEG